MKTRSRWIGEPPTRSSRSGPRRSRLSKLAAPMRSMVCSSPPRGTTFAQSSSICAIRATPRALATKWSATAPLLSTSNPCTPIHTRAAGGIGWRMAGFNAISVRATASCRKGREGSASCDSAWQTGWSSPPTVAPPGSASIRSKKSPSITFFQARASSPSERQDAISAAVSARTGTSPSPARLTGSPTRPLRLRSPRRRAVAVTAGYMREAARAEFYAKMDAANVDLKAFTEDFYQRITFSHLQPVLETLQYLHHQTRVWLEITTLLIPGHNDSEREVTELSEWLMQSLGPDVPLHFTAFHPDFKMTDLPNTPAATLRRARAIARRCGLHYVYTGNVHDVEGGTTFCPNCGRSLIARDWYDIQDFQLRDGTCPSCKTVIPGCFERVPGNFGRRRIPVAIHRAGTRTADS